MLFASYRIKTDHRNSSRAAYKSQWIIDSWSEMRLFASASSNGWRTPASNVLWSVEKDGAGLRVIGQAGSEDLLIAKYICDGNSEWHGYPVLPKQHDRPPSEVLKAWSAAHLISNNQLNRWVQGKV